MSLLPGKLNDIIDQLNMVDDVMERSHFLVSYANKFETIPSEIAQPPYPKQNMVPHCESEAYVWVQERNDHTVKLYFAVDNPSGISAKALAVILDQALSGLPPEQVARVNPDIVEKIFRQNMSMGKGMGLSAMVQAVRVKAERIAQQRAMNED
ncbi:MAG: hypothetical protein GF313_17275 [Caldithrix sp.]|nr:hypothetical protein [Caldithrix sp.]